MKLYLHLDTLIQNIQRFGASARDHRQVQKRLQQLLPDRLDHLVGENRRSGLKPSVALRQALVSKDYLDLLDEMVQVGQESTESRIQYETHMMLFEARQSLRHLRR